MTTPKNTQQDKIDAKAYADKAFTNDESLEWDYCRRDFLAGRLGYVPNQTVVAIAEAARKEERERCAEVVRKLFFDKQVEAFAVEHILNPPEAK